MIDRRTSRERRSYRFPRSESVTVDSYAELYARNSRQLTRIPFSPLDFLFPPCPFVSLRSFVSDAARMIRRWRCNGSPHDQPTWALLPPPVRNIRKDRWDYMEAGHNVQTVARQQAANGPQNVYQRWSDPAIEFLGWSTVERRNLNEIPLCSNRHGNLL